MRYKNIILTSLITIFGLSLSSCGLIDFSDFTRPRTTNNVESSTNTSSINTNYELTTTYDDLGNYYIDETPVDDTYNLKNINYSLDTDTVSSTGDVSLLVIPVEFSDYTFSDDGYTSYDLLYSDLNRVFNGTSSDTGYFESVKSFYKESSYDKLNLSFDIATVYQADKTAKELYEMCVSNGDVKSEVGSNYILEKAVENYKNINGSDSTKKYDNDSDGLIDAVMLIYSCPNTYKNKSVATATGDTYSDLYWAYCYWLSSNCNKVISYPGVNGNKTKEEYIASPEPCSYFWCSYDFIYSYKECSIGNKVDSHTLVHEFGHLLGLDDYYSYDDDSYSRVGSSDMMDGNIYDHSAVSKLLLGWINPYIVTGDATISLKSLTSSGQCIILTPEYNGNVFQEYILIEFFTPDGLNYTDSHNAYTTGNNAICNTLPGIKISHVDARLAIFKKGKWDYLEEKPDYKKYSFDFAFTNSIQRDRIKDSNDYDFVRVIRQDKSLGEKNTSSYSLKNDHLFNTFSSFNMNDYKDQFDNQKYFNNYKELGYSVSIKYVPSLLNMDGEAVIQFTKL